MIFFAGVSATLSALNPSSQEQASEPRRKEAVHRSLYLSSPNNNFQNKPVISATIGSSNGTAAQDTLNNQRKLPIIRGETTPKTSSLNESVALINLSDAKPLNSENVTKLNSQELSSHQPGDDSIEMTVQANRRKTRRISGKQSAKVRLMTNTLHLRANYLLQLCCSTFACSFVASLLH